MRRFCAIPLSAILFVCASCGVDVPVDPANVLGGLGNALDNVGDAVTGALNDPLSSKPFPVLIGGDESEVFYATNLGDIKVNFPGSTNDFVLPGLFGPTNLYRYAAGPRKRELVQPLIPAGGFAGLVTDGRYVAYASFEGLATETGVMSVTVVDLSTLESRIVFDGTRDEDLFTPGYGMKLSDGRLAFRILDGATTPFTERLRIDDLTGIEPTVELEAMEIGDLAMRGDRLAYSQRTSDDVVQIVLRDLSNGTETIIDDQVRVEFAYDLRVTLSDNQVVWAELDSTAWQVMAYDIPSGETRVWADGVTGELAGASDTHFVTAESISEGFAKPTKVRVVRYDAEARSRKLAEFRADGLAGQVTVIGNRAAWVNPDREVVLAPLAGGDRTSFKPF